MMFIIHVMNLRSIDLNLLAVFDAIYTERSLTRAARKVPLSQPAMSNALRRLRESLEDPLFTRTAQGMIPTPRARALAEPVRQALDLIQNGLRRDAEFDFGSSHRKFTVAAEDYGEAVIMPRLMDWITHVAPYIRLEIRPEPGSSLGPQLKDGLVDIALDYFALKGNEFEVQAVIDETLVTMSRRDHPLIGDTLGLDQFASIPHLALTPRTRTTPVVDRALAGVGLKRRIAAQAPHFLSMPLIVQNTNLLCTLPKRMAHVYADVFRLKVLKTPVDLPAFPIYLMWHRSMNDDPGHQWLRTAIIELCQRI